MSELADQAPPRQTRTRSALDQVLELGGDDDHRHPLCSQSPDHCEHLRLRADVDPARELVHQEHVAPVGASQLADYELLLVAAGAAARGLRAQSRSRRRRPSPSTSARAGPGRARDSTSPTRRVHVPRSRQTGVRPRRQATEHEPLRACGPPDVMPIPSPIALAHRARPRRRSSLSSSRRTARPRRPLPRSPAGSRCDPTRRARRCRRSLRDRASNGIRFVHAAWDD